MNIARALMGRVLPLATIIATLAFTPGAVRYYDECRYLCYLDTAVRTLPLREQDRICRAPMDERGFCTRLDIRYVNGFLLVPTRNDPPDGWTQPLPDLKAWGLY